MESKEKMIGKEKMFDHERSIEELEKKRSKPHDIAITVNDDLDRILSNLEKVSLGHFGNVCE